MCKGTACIAEKRHVIDAVVTVQVTEHQTLEIPICMIHGNTRKGEFPTEIKAAVQYGENLQALSVALNTIGAVSVKRTHEIISGVFNIPIATGTISNMVNRCASKVTDYIPVLFLLNVLIGINGLVWAQPVVDILSMVVGIGMYIIISKK